MATAIDPLIGTDLDGYRIEELLGRGGMGVVYRAFDPRLKRRVALKLVAPDLSEDDRFRERFLRETELAASLDHPNVIPVYDAGEHEGHLFLTMRYVDGSDLRAELAAGPLDPARAVRVCAQVAAALDAAHERGLVHRDVKPSNVLLDTHDHAYLADFGLTSSFSAGRLAGEGLSLGTPAYASPEQILGGTVDGRADVYALGCMLYECLTGRLPFARGTKLATLFAHVHEPPQPASASNARLPVALDTVVGRALEVEPQDRYSSCRELVEAAQQALGVRDGVGAGRGRGTVVGAAVLLLAIAAAGAALVLGTRDDPTGTDLTVTGNTVVRLDRGGGEIAGVVPTGIGPESIAASGKAVWVYNWEDRTVSQLDAETGEVARTRSIRGAPPFAETSSSIAADDNEAWVLSTSGGKGLLTRLPVDDPVRLPRETSFAHDPQTIAVGDEGVWIGARGDLVLRVDPRTGGVADVVPIERVGTDFGGGAPENVRVAVGEGSVWALLGRTVFRIDPTVARITGRARIAGSGSGIAAGLGTVWASIWNGTGKQLVRLDPDTLELLGTTDAPDVPGSDSESFVGSVVMSGDTVWWNGTNTGIVWRIDPARGEIVGATEVTPPVDSYDDIQPYAATATDDAVWVTVRTAP